MKRHLLLLSLTLTTILNGATVLCTANGTVSNSSGVYQADGIAAGTPVTIEMKYDDQAGNKSINAPFPGSEDLDFWNAIMLSVKVTIGSRSWSGGVESSIEGPPASFLVRLRDFQGGSESLIVTLQETDAATFEHFPLESEPENNTIQLSFFSSNNAFLTDQITASSIDESLITSASGFLQSGSANKISFSLDHTSVVIENFVPPTPTPVLNLNRTNDNLSISWDSAIDFNYQLQSSLTLEEDSWTDVGSTLFGNGGTLSTNVAIAQGFNIFYRVVAEPAPEL